MCLILFAFRSHPDFPLIIAANRDEAYARPTATARFWADHPHVYGGRDLEMGGAWMGIDTRGRFAAVTNFRDGVPKGAAPRSRGEVVGSYLIGNDDASAHLQRIAERQSEYAGFGMLAGDLKALWFLSNYGAGVAPVAPGVHGLSNHLLDTPWPKVAQGKAQLGALLEGSGGPQPAALFDLLADRSVAPPTALPDTGVGIEREKQLAPKFIAVDARYGTRASTVVLVHRDGEVHYAERSFGPHGKLLGEVARRFRLTKPA